MSQAPFEQIIITNLEGDKPLGRAMVFKIPPTCAEHNVVTELMKRLRREFPGAWFCVQQWERQQYPLDQHHTTSPAVESAIVKQTQVQWPNVQPVIGKMKAVSREHLGLPAEDDLGDLPM